MPKLNKAFWKWFGDSVVVDEDGSPKVAYHGTTENFSKFRMAEGKHWAGPGRDDFVKARHAFFTDSEETARTYGPVMRVFIRIENPLVFNAEGESYETFIPYHCIGQAVAGGHDGVIVENILDDASGGGEEGTTYIIFHPSQIKSVENDGAWDPSNPNIMRNPRSKERKLPRWMNSTRSMWNWASRSVGDFGSEMEDEPPEVRRLFKGQMEEQFGDYWGIADTARWKGFADIYRMISVDESCLGDPQKMLSCVDVEEIGHYWSAEESGAGSYGKHSSGGVDILLRGTVAFEDIDWEHGFTSFCYYPDQLEIAVKHNANIVLTGIEGHKIDPPVVVNSGSAEGYIHRSQ